MNVPSTDHAGWGRLLAAVMETEATVTAPRQTERKVDATERIQRRERLERTVVLEGGTDVYA